MATDEVMDKEKDDDKDWWTSLVGLIIVVGIGIWMYCTNPSEADHQDAIKKEIQEASAQMVLTGETPSAAQLKAIATTLDYHSLGVVSWTTYKFHGTKISSIGLFGHVFSLVDGI